jgi:hypothetical protein
MKDIPLRAPAALFILSLLFALLSGPASAQTCVSYETTNIVAGTLTLHGSDPGLASAVQAAAEKLLAGVRDLVFPIGSFPPALPFETDRPARHRLDLMEA